MKIGVSSGRIAPINSAAFLPRSYNPKAKVPISTTKRAATQLKFSVVLSAMLKTDTSHLPQKAENKAL